jgi:hypothetical protein
MPREYQISFTYNGSTVYLSKTGAAISGSNLGCKNEITLPPNFRSEFIKSAPRLAFRGEVNVTLTEVVHRAKRIGITVETLPVAVQVLLETLFADADDDGADVTLTATHPTTASEDFAYTGKVLSFNYSEMSPNRQNRERATIDFISTGLAA